MKSKHVKTKKDITNLGRERKAPRWSWRCYSARKEVVFRRTPCVAFESKQPTRNPLLFALQNPPPESEALTRGEMGEASTSCARLSPCPAAGGPLVTGGREGGGVAAALRGATERPKGGTAAVPRGGTAGRPPRGPARPLRVV